MGYINKDSNTIILDCILTKKGRELLAMGNNQFNITKFSVSDDGVDYDLWNPSHPKGTTYYGEAIEALPLTEACTDESNNLKYKLVTLPKNTTHIPIISVATSNITFSLPGQSQIVKPSTVNLVNGNNTLGYTAILANSTVATLQVNEAITSATGPTTPRYIGDSSSATSVSCVGLSFKLIAKTNILQDMASTLTIIGNETGGRTVINILVKKALTEDLVSSTIPNLRDPLITSNI